MSLKKILPESNFPAENIFHSQSTPLLVNLDTKKLLKQDCDDDITFIRNVKDDVKCFRSTKRVDSVLVFPPVNNYRRFLIHRCVEELGLPELTTFSIGFSDERRTVVCYQEKLLSDEAGVQPAMGLRPVEHEDAAVSQPVAAVGGCKAQAQRGAQPQEQIRSGTTRPRRPDRAVYIPRALRTEEVKPPESKKRITEQTKSPKSPSKEKAPHTPRKSTDKKCINLYTPPHLRNQTSHRAPSIEEAQVSEKIETVPFGLQVPNITTSDNICKEVDEAENFYIGDYFANGQLGLFDPAYYDYVDKTDKDWITNDKDKNMATNEAQQIIENDYLYNKDEDIEKNELKRASQEINRTSKRIIKQTFDNDVLVISDPVEESKAENVESSPKEEKIIEKNKPKLKLEKKTSMKREENDWDTVFDEDGECLDPTLLEELAKTVGKVQISNPKNSYAEYQSKGQALFNKPIDQAFQHVIEVYDFPSEFKTHDLLSLFSEYKETGFEIKWVDDTHALIVFSSAKIAAEVLSTQRPLARCRPLHAATLESRNKAKKCAEFFQPYRQRPETCTALARRLVSGALGVKLSTAQQERAEERRLITIAREKKRQAALHKEAAWDGSLANQSVSES